VDQDALSQESSRCHTAVQSYWIVAPGAKCCSPAHTKVLIDTFVQLFGCNASGVIALCRRFHSKGA